jgi:hypothetical protein
MDDKDLDTMIRERLKAETKSIPVYLTEKKKVVLDNLSSRKIKARPWLNYGIVAAAIFLVFTASFLQYIFNNKPLVNQNLEQMLNETIEQKTITVTEEERKELASQGYIVENKVASMEKIPTGTGAASFQSEILKTIPNTIEKLANKSEIIIKGQVIGVRYFEYKSRVLTGRRMGIYTESKIKVLRSYNDKVQAGDVLTFVEEGGITTKYKYYETIDTLDKFPLSNEEIEKAKKEYVMTDGYYSGVPVMNPNDYIVIFGVEDKEENYGLPEKTYISYFSSLGKFKFKDNMVENFVPPVYRDIYTPIKMSISEMETKLQQQ